jgi:hypothetical protein
VYGKSGVHAKRISVTGDSSLATYWLTDRRSPSHGTHDASRHCIRSTLRHNGHRGIVVALWTTRLETCRWFVYTRRHFEGSAVLLRHQFSQPSCWWRQNGWCAYRINNGSLPFCSDQWSITHTHMFTDFKLCIPFTLKIFFYKLFRIVCFYRLLVFFMEIFWFTSVTDVHVKTWRTIPALSR